MVEVLKPSYVARENANDAAIVENSLAVMIELPFQQAVHCNRVEKTCQRAEGIHTKCDLSL